jgi:hypothetical protein
MPLLSVHDLPVDEPDPTGALLAPADPAEFGGSAWCMSCYAAVGEESLTDGYCWSCGEPGPFDPA